MGGTVRPDYFFNAGPPEFGSSFDDLDAICRYMYEQRAERGAAEVYALLGGSAEFDLDEFNAALARTVERVYRHPRTASWRVWFWTRGEATCLLLRWTAF